MKEIKAPDALPGLTEGSGIFLAGSIEQGAAPEWQARVVAAVADLDVTIFNPRRDDWDASWKQSMDDPQFSEQVEWELSALELADQIAMYFAPETQSPITLLELGLFARSGKLIVCCPEGFWRKGNVDIVCRRYHVDRVKSMEELITSLRSEIR